MRERERKDRKILRERNKKRVFVIEREREEKVGKYIYI